MLYRYMKIQENMMNILACVNTRTESTRNEEKTTSESFSEISDSGPELIMKFLAYFSPLEV